MALKNLLTGFGIDCNEDDWWVSWKLLKLQDSDFDVDSPSFMKRLAEIVGGGNTEPKGGIVNMANMIFEQFINCQEKLAELNKDLEEEERLKSTS